MRERAENQGFRRERRQNEGGGNSPGEDAESAGNLLMGTRARDGGGRKKPWKTGLSAERIGCEQDKLRLHDNRRSMGPRR